ncbi:MAG: AAA family ATPase [Bryobacterales bacterium]|nr:AAA family ATPase [Bryobacterales bacterium]
MQNEPLGPQDLEDELISMIINWPPILDGDWSVTPDNESAKFPGVIGYMEPTDFMSVANEVTYRALVAMHTEGMNITATRLVEYLRQQGQLDQAGGQYRLITVAGLQPDTRLYYWHMKLILRAWAKRQIFNIQKDIGPAIAAGDTEKVDKLNAELDAVHKRVNVAKQGLTDDTSVTDLLKQWYNNPQEIRGFRTGIEDLDKAIGGLDKSELLLVLGYTGSGKSTLMMQFALQFAEQGYGMIIPTEMSVNQYKVRMIAFELGVDYQQLYLGQYRDWERLESCARYIEALPIEWYKAGRPTPDQIEKAVRTIDRVQPLDWVIVDGVNDISVPGATGPDITSQAISCLHGIARSGKLVACTAHMNRDSKQRSNKEPNPRDAFGSSRIEQLATRIVTIWRPGHMVETGEADGMPEGKNGDAPVSPNMAYLRLVKSRFTATGQRIETFYGIHKGRLGFHKVKKETVDFSTYNGNGRSR